MLMETATIIPLHEAEKRTARAAITRLPIYTAKELGEEEFPAIKYVIPGFVPEGATILAGRPKLGKSWLALDMALAVSQGTDCLGVTCERGAVLYLALEDNKRRMQSRLDKLSPRYDQMPWPSNLSLANEWQRHDAGGTDSIRDWATSADNPRLVIVDVLAQFRTRGGERDDYRSDYDSIKALQELAGEMQLAIIVVHHVRKSAGETDPFEKVSGTLGLTGAADTAIILDKDGHGCTLYGRGRDIQEFERSVMFDPITCRWSVQGEASQVRRTDERQTILEILDDADETMSPGEVADATGCSRNNVKQLLFKMAKAGEVLKAGRGKYVSGNRPELLPRTPDNHGNQITNGEEDD